MPATATPTPTSSTSGKACATDVADDGRPASRSEAYRAECNTGAKTTTDSDVSDDASMPGWVRGGECCAACADKIVETKDWE